jgi:EAL domain-containing protein (putative c-di-GMP-specific phosphodiesterase class I)
MQLKCDLIQGYYYSKPLPMEAFVKYLLAPQIAETGASISKYAEGNK